MKRSLALFLIVFVSWTIIRIFTSINDGWEEILIKPVVFLIPAYFLSDRKSIFSFFSEMGFSKEKLLLNIFLGICAVTLLIAYAEFIRHFLVGKDFRLTELNIHSPTFLFNIFISFFTAFSEEIIFRGFIFKRLLIEKRGLVFSLILSTAGFVLLHIPRAIFVLHSSGADLFSYLYLLTFLSIIDTLIFWKTKNIEASITTHTLWNIYSSI